MSKRHLLIALLAVGIAAPAWSQEVRLKDPTECVPKKGDCVSAIVFTRLRDGIGDIYLGKMNDDGTRQLNPDQTWVVIRLTENEGGGNGFPKLSPEGKRIVF